MYNIKRGCLKSQFFEKLATKSPRRKALTFNFIFLCASATSWQIKTFETASLKLLFEFAGIKNHLTVIYFPLQIF